MCKNAVLNFLYATCFKWHIRVCVFGCRVLTNIFEIVNNIMADEIQIY